MAHNVEKFVPYKFNKGERVLCVYEDVLYDAKVMAQGIKDLREPQYFVHYIGWNKAWDEWVSGDRLLECNAENNEKKENQRYSAKQQSRRKTTSKKAQNKKLKLDDTSASGSSSTEIPNEKEDAEGQKESPVENSTNNKIKSKPMKYVVPMLHNGDFSNRKSYVKDTHGQEGQKDTIHIEIPEILKGFLYNDRTEMEIHKVLYKIPATITVQKIAEDFLNFDFPLNLITAHGSTHHRIYNEEFVNGILAYFNKILGTKLLYRLERTQFEDISKAHPDVPAAQLYGYIHLVRLFVSIGHVLEMTGASKVYIEVILPHIDDFVAFLALKGADYYLTQNPE